MDWAGLGLAVTGVGATVAGVDPGTISDINRVGNAIIPHTVQQPGVNTLPTQTAAQRAAALPGWATAMLWAGGGIIVLVLGLKILK